MSDKFAVEIISPEKTILKTDASEVILPSYEGEIGILKNHIPLITFLRPGLINIKGSMEIMFFAEDGSEIDEFRVQGEVSADRLETHLAQVLAL